MEDFGSYRRCVAVFLMNCGLVFAGERSDNPGAWQLPQGGVNVGEDDSAAAVRELYEETGVRSVALTGSTAGFYCYDFPVTIQEKFNRYHEGRFVGQRVRFFRFKFSGLESEIDLIGDGYHEFSNWRWMPVSELLDGLIDCKKEAFRKAAAELELI
jgi:putative (di)nucleoside polyphosphate hydrolase